MEVLVCKRSSLPLLFLPVKGAFFCSSLERVVKLIPAYALGWRERGLVEEDPTYKQMIAYVLIQRGEDLLLYPRRGTETRLHSFYSIGIGGHVERKDWKGDLTSALIHCMKREAMEEIGFYSTPRFLGCINDDTNPVGKVHMGFVFVLNHSGPIIPSDEIKDAKWVDFEALSRYPLESWSRLAWFLLKAHRQLVSDGEANAYFPEKV